MESTAAVIYSSRYSVYLCTMCSTLANSKSEAELKGQPSLLKNVLIGELVVGSWKFHVNLSSVATEILLNDSKINLKMLVCTRLSKTEAKMTQGHRLRKIFFKQLLA